MVSAGGMLDPVEIFLSSNLIIMQNLRAYVGGPQNWRRWSSAPGMGVPDPLEARHMLPRGI